MNGRESAGSCRAMPIAPSHSCRTGGSPAPCTPGRRDHEVVAAKPAANHPRMRGWAATGAGVRAHHLGIALLATVMVLKSSQAGAREPAAPPQHLPVEARWCPVGSKSCVALEVPRTWHQYILGLQMRPPLAPGRGMWFAYRPAQVARFWMHRTPASLDMIFVSQNRVVAIAAAVPPCMRLPCPAYGPATPVDGVLELGAGEATRLGLSVGSPLRVEPLRPFGPRAPAPD